MCGWLSCTPYWGPGPQPRPVPWLGIELVTLWFTGRYSIHWAIPARDKRGFLISANSLFCFYNHQTSDNVGPDITRLWWGSIWVMFHIIVHFIKYYLDYNLTLHGIKQEENIIDYLIKNTNQYSCYIFSFIIN